jgi:hypothetical protein
MANFSRRLFEILVHYTNFLGYQGKEPAFVGVEKHPQL